MDYDGSTATATGEPADPVAIAARVSALEHKQRVETIAADVERWREIVNAVAGGKEPDGEQLRDIGPICHRLGLPPDALSIAVAAVQRDRELSGAVDHAKKIIDETRVRRDQIVPRIKELEAELLALRTEIAKGEGAAMGLPTLFGAKNEHRGNNPLLFANVQKFAEHLVKPSQPRPQPTASSASWS